MPSAIVVFSLSWLVANALGFTRSDINGIDLLEYDALNAATASYKLGERSQFTSSVPGTSETQVAFGTLAAVVVASCLFLARQSLIPFRVSTSAVLPSCDVVPSLGDLKKLVVYASLALHGGDSPAPNVALSTGGKITNKKAVRRQFSLEGPASKLDPCQLTVPSHRFTTRLDDALMPATLEPLGDMFGFPSPLITTPIATPPASSEVKTKTSEKRHPGRKPSLEKLRNQQYLHRSSPGYGSFAEKKSDLVRAQVSRPPKTPASRPSYSEWDDSDWEDEERAPFPETGDPMDGDDVGVLPHRKLVLPAAAVKYPKLGVAGRSIFQSDWPIPSGE